MLCIFRQLCEALAHMHSKGIIHRDVHPTRIHSAKGLMKFNMIGMPYNYKKLLKKDNFKPERLQAGLAENQIDAAVRERLEQVEHGGPLGRQPHSFGVEADGPGEFRFLEQECEILAEQGQG